MTLFEYYKKAVFEYGYDTAKRGQEASAEIDGIDYQDEFDWNICADYYGSYVGAREDWSAEDIEFLKVLGFTPEDFEHD